MTPKEFVSCIQRSVLKENLGIYLEILATSNAEVKDAAWRQVIAGYATMNEEQRRSVVAFISKVMLDTASNILGILDGTCLLEGYREEFVLTYGDSKEKLNGDLQDYLLSDGFGREDKEG